MTGCALAISWQPAHKDAAAALRNALERYERKQIIPLARRTRIAALPTPK